MHLPYDDPGRPDLRSPSRFLVWIARGQWRTQVGGAVFGTIWMVSMALTPAAISRAIDRGIVAEDDGQLWRWAGAVLGLSLVAAIAGIWRHRFAVLNWLQANYRVTQLVGYYAADTGAALPRAMPTGKVVATVSSDAPTIGSTFDVLGRTAGALVSFVVVAVLLLVQSVQLGLLVLLGVPLLMASLSVVMKPLQRRQEAQREEAGRLTELGADTVAGLRVLRGIGGEETFLHRYERQSQAVRARGVQVAGLQSTLDAAQVLLPGVFTLVVVWAGGHVVVSGDLTVGQLVGFYGFTAFLVMPLRTFTETVDKVIQARVAARKVIGVLQVTPDASDVATPTPLPGGGELADPDSRVVVRPGQLTALVSARPEESSAVVDRLGRFGDTETDATYGGVRLADAPLDDVRRRVVVSENDPRLFTGALREQLDPRAERSDEQLLELVHVASGADVMTALPDGLDSAVEERGRSFSGGQRQRLALVRALAVDAEVLLMVEPTSAVDAHTEARIAERLARHRAGRTTLVTTASPLLLDHCDHVLLLDGGRVVAAGTHHELLRTSRAYRDVVVRGEDT